MVSVIREALPAQARLRITEIFRSLQGEALTAGMPTVFVRLTGCPLRCQYCDTAYAFSGGTSYSVEQVIEQVAALQTTHVCVTGGEPLAQPGCISLCTALCDAGHRVSLETSGAMDVSLVDARVSKVLDLKTPGSGELARNRYDNIEHLQAHDQVKFVVCDRADFEWALRINDEHDLASRCTVWLSPSHEQLELTTLATWLLDSGAPLRLQVQLHKYIWGDEPGR
ncbi:MAG: 7-carboxy-7-deazaguanine synthase QueE [Pseudomonadota bacterium]